jgi:hypothetical protein
MKPSIVKVPEFQPASASNQLPVTGTSLTQPNVLQIASNDHPSQVGREETLNEKKSFSVLTPTVDAAREFLEIATDFSNPLDLVREGISNSIDSKASEIRISFNTEIDAGERILICEIEDNGDGMNLQGMQAFFDLGNSTRRSDQNAIGEKGHGTKIYVNSSLIRVITVHEGVTITATMDQPFRNLSAGKIPTVKIELSETPQAKKGTKITIRGYNNNRREFFTQSLLRDYVIWFTKFGSAEAFFGLDTHVGKTLYLKGLDILEAEKIPFGHYFPEENYDVDELFKKHTVDAPDFYCKKYIKEGQLTKFPEIRYQAIIYVEGNKVKIGYNPLLKRQGYSKGVYRVTDRYGIWAAKDFIPVQQINDWFGSKGSEHTRLHGFVNCQDISLTANRGSINNTPSEILEELRNEVGKIYDDIVTSEDWCRLDALQGRAKGYESSNREKKDFSDRKKNYNKSRIATILEHQFNEPTCEGAVFAMVTRLSLLKMDIFPFQPLDYATHQGYDLLVKGDSTTPIHQSQIFYVELKWWLTNFLNHSFENLKCIVTWGTKVLDGGFVTDINGEERIMRVVGPTRLGEYTKYMLDNPRFGTKIEVIVLKDYLREMLNVEFRTRTVEQSLR